MTKIYHRIRYFRIYSPIVWLRLYYDYTAIFFRSENTLYFIFKFIWFYARHLFHFEMLYNVKISKERHNFDCIQYFNGIYNMIILNKRISFHRRLHLFTMLTMKWMSEPRFALNQFCIDCVWLLFLLPFRRSLIVNKLWLKVVLFDVWTLETIQTFKWVHINSTIMLKFLKSCTLSLVFCIKTIRGKILP